MLNLKLKIGILIYIYAYIHVICKKYLDHYDICLFHVDVK